jgi:hypothetical protein
METDMKKVLFPFLTSLTFLALLLPAAATAATQTAADLEYPFKDLFKYKFTYSHPTGKSASGNMVLFSSFHLAADSNRISCPAAYDTNFAVNPSGEITEITGGEISNTSYQSTSAYYYCYTPAGSSPFSVSFNRASEVAVTYAQKTVSSGKTELANHISGYSSQNEALEHIEILGDLNIRENVEIDGYYAVHAKSVGFVRGASISTNRAFLIIADGDVKFDSTNSVCSWPVIGPIICAHLPLEKNISISNTYILSGGTVSLNSGWIKVSSGLASDNNSTQYQPGVYLDNVRISAADITMSHKYLASSFLGLFEKPTPLKYNSDSRDDYYILSSNLVSFPSKDLWNFDLYQENPVITVSTSGSHASCEQGWVSVTASDSSADAVTLTIKSGNAVFLQNGTVSSTADVLTDGSRVSVMARGSGAVEIGVADREYKCESDCTLAFSDSVLRILPLKSLSSAFDSSNNAFYAGREVETYLAVIKNSEDDPSVCKTGTLKDGKVNLSLTYNTSVRSSGLDFISSANTSVASSSGIEIIPEFDGTYYKIPSFRYYDAGIVTLKASGIMNVAGVSSDTVITGSSIFRYSPYGIQINVQSTCGSDEECAKVTALSADEKYLAGLDFNIFYIPKAYCSAGESGKSEDLASCPTVPSYGYDSDHVQEISVSAENTRDSSAEKGNYLSPNVLKLNQHAADDGSGSASSDGSTLRVSEISDVGNYTLAVKEYTDAVSGLTVGRSTLALSGLVAPYDFEFRSYSPAQPQIRNSCGAVSSDQLSFTYFGQPVAPKLYVKARSKSGSAVTFFDRDHYPLIDRYSLDAELFTSSDGTYTPLYNVINKVRSKRIVSCTDCGDSVLGDSWKGGFLYLNATDSELMSLGGTGLNSASRHYRILAKGYTPDLEGTKLISDYRSESPRYDGSTWNRFYVFMSLGIRESVDADSVYRGVSASDSSGSLVYSYTDLAGKTATAALYRQNPLEMRMGRLALSNARTAPGSSLFMPVKTEYYRRVMNGDTVASEGWVANNDDSCTVLSRDVFFIEPFGKTEGTVYLKDSPSVDYGNGMISEKAELVNVRNSTAETGDRITADHGMMYLRISSPEKKSDAASVNPVMFQLRDSSVGRSYPLAPGASYVPVRDITGTDPVSSGPYWLGTTLEGVDQSQGAFRAWPGNDRVLFRLDGTR